MTIQDMILVVTVFVMLVFGLLIMKRWDKFLDENRKRIEQEKKGKEPSCTVLTTKLSDEELIQRIRTYEEQHGEAKITLYPDEDDR